MHPIRESLRKAFGTPLEESSLSRVWQFATQPGRVFAILTAFRGEYSYEENVQRNSELKKEARANGFGFFEMEGHWVENPGTPQEEDVVEESLFISLPAQPNAEQKLYDFTLDMIRKYDQEGAVIKPVTDSNEIFIIGRDENMFSIGEFKPMKVAQAYSKMKGGKTFVFESAVSHSWIGKIKSNRA